MMSSQSHLSENFPEPRSQDKILDEMGEDQSEEEAGSESLILASPQQV